MSSLESDCEDPSTCQTRNVTRPSGISNLFNNNEKPLNAFVITSKPPPLMYAHSTGSIHQDFTPSSLDRSSAYFTASLPNSISNDNWSYNGEDQVAPSDCYLSTTVSSSNCFDNQSDYEVILDDGSRQKRTISLSTIKLLPSKQHNHGKSTFLDNFITSSKDRRNNR